MTLDRATLARQICDRLDSRQDDIRAQWQASNPVQHFVVDDQYGSPTYAPHLAHVVLATASHILKTRDTSLWGTYHAAGTGSTSRRGFAELLLVHSAACGGPVAPVHPVGTTDYLTRAKRPLNSRLDCSKLERMFGLALPRWESGVRNCVERILGRIREDIPESMAGRYAP